MIDKEKYTAFIKNDDTRVFIIKNISKLEGVLQHYDIRKTDFMDPYERKLFRAILNAFKTDISYMEFGGDEESERKVFVIYPAYLFYEDIPIKLLRLKGNFKFEKISHRDCLGMLMSLGLTREKIGDIHIHKDFVDVVIDDNIGNYMISNITSIRRCSVKSEVLPIQNMVVSELEFTEKDYSVSSLRLDNVIAEAFNLSRAAATDMVKSANVKINYETVSVASKEIEEGDLVSVRGFGRFIFVSSKGFSRKGKKRISLKHYK